MIPEFHYRIDWRSASVHPGHHRSVHTGGGYEFQGYAALHQTANPRHLDLRASLRDPQGQFQVRLFRQSSAVSVFLLADVSASMQHPSRLDTLSAFAASLACSTYRTGDRFSLLAADAGVRDDLMLPADSSPGGMSAWRERAGRAAPGGHSADGLLALAAYTGHHRALVFLVSDFHFPLSRIEPLREALAWHDVVPVVVWEPADPASLPDYRLVHWQDPETGEGRRYWMRPALKARIKAAYAERRRQLEEVFLSGGRAPLFLESGFEADAVTRYFYQP